MQTDGTVARHTGPGRPAAGSPASQRLLTDLLGLYGGEFWALRLSLRVSRQPVQRRLRDGRILDDPLETSHDGGFRKVDAPLHGVPGLAFFRYLLLRREPPIHHEHPFRRRGACVKPQEVRSDPGEAPPDGRSSVPLLLGVNLMGEVQSRCSSSRARRRCRAACSGYPRRSSRSAEASRRATLVRSRAYSSPYHSRSACSRPAASYKRCRAR